ncbi:MAG: exodeoxyribonuclease VII large subunit [Alphaproteobacteria bacterium]|nr:exodeoxyribonuclease VII large subunit [Alphaproteobacteria bacterium]
MSETDSPPLIATPEPRAANAPEYSVSELSTALKKMVEDGFGFVRVRGELSGVKHHSSGHIYMDLKDDRASLAGVIWKMTAARLRVRPENGLEVVAIGRLTTFPGQSKYQIIIEQLQLAGVGALMQLLEQRRKKLAAEGLFDDAHKKPLPYLPKVIGVVTSPTGAVIRDILHRLADRFPRRVIVWPVAVQGERSAAEVTAAIQGFNALQPGGPIPRPDVIIVARGGGSVEDLLSFSEENVVRAVFASTIPVISAVGHETDTTLIDFVSDRRAPTPTAAAEMAVPVRNDLLRQISDRAHRLETGRTRVFTLARQRLTDLSRALPRRERLLEIPRQRFDHAASKLGGALTLLVHKQRARFDRASTQLSPTPMLQSARRQRERVRDFAHRMQLSTGRRVTDLAQSLNAAGKLLETLSYRSILDRGFALVSKTGKGLVERGTEIKPGDKIQLTFADGTVPATATGAIVQGATPPVSRKKVKTAGQGDLF